MAFSPITSAHSCRTCGKPIRKNNQSYRGPIPTEMAAAVRRDKPELKPPFHVKDDICKECGQKYFDQVAGALRKPPWMTRPLG